MSDPVGIYSIGCCSPLGGTWLETVEAYYSGYKAPEREETWRIAKKENPRLAKALPINSAKSYVERLCQLCARAFTDCIAGMEMPTGAPFGTLVIINLPEWMPTVANAVDRITEFLKALPELQGYPLELQFEGNAGGHTCLAQTAQRLSNHTVHAAFAVAIDSWISPDLLNSLYADDRLKINGVPYGFIPGEAAVVLGMRRCADMPTDVMPISVPLRHVSDHETERPLDVEGAIMGASLGRCFQNIVEDQKDALPPAVLCGDINSERFRGEDFGLAVVRGGNGLGPGRFEPEIPAVALGDTGAASGLMGIALMCAYPLLGPHRRYVAPMGRNPNDPFYGELEDEDAETPEEIAADIEFFGEPFFGALEPETEEEEEEDPSDPKLTLYWSANASGARSAFLMSNHLSPHSPGPLAPVFEKLRIEKDS